MKIVLELINVGESFVDAKEYNSEGLKVIMKYIDKIFLTNRYVLQLVHFKVSLILNAIGI